MSLQQVNLYQDELKKQKLNYSAAMTLQLSAIILIVFSVVAGYSSIQLQQRKQALQEHQQLQKQAMADLQKIQQELSLRKKDFVLSKRLADKTRELGNKQKVLGILSQDEFGNTKGFVEHITGLARQRVEGLWLTRLRIAEGGTDIALHGTTSKSSLLPRYLQKLSAEKIFSGTEFKSLVMVRQKKKPQWLDFSLQNKRVDEDNP